MTSLAEAKMAKLEEEGSSGRHVVWIAVAGLGIVMTGGAIVGFMSEINSSSDDVKSGPALAALGIFVAIIAGLAYSILRNALKIKQSEYPLSRREKLNNQIMVGSAIFGGLVAVVLVLSGDVSSGISDGPISPAIAIGVAFAFGVLVPLMSYYWHKKVVDEQEDAAYRSGALIAIYAFWIGAPVWWLLWRGGLVPAPDGITIYFITTFTAVIVWFWKKYR